MSVDGTAHDIFDVGAVETKKRLGNFEETRVEGEIFEIGFGFGEVGNAIKSGIMTTAEVAKLWENIPDPMGGFAAPLNFGKSLGIIGGLGFEEAREVVRVRVIGVLSRG